MAGIINRDYIKRLSLYFENSMQWKNAWLNSVSQKVLIFQMFSARAFFIPKDSQFFEMRRFNIINDFLHHPFAD